MNGCRCSMCRRPIPTSKAGAAVTTVEALRRARGLIAAGWVQRSFAADADGNAMDDEDDRACRFCMSGAIFRATVGCDDGVYADALRLLVEAVPGHSIVGFNDAPERTQADVLAVFDRAIAAAEASS